MIVECRETKEVSGFKVAITIPIDKAIEIVLPFSNVYPDGFDERILAIKALRDKYTGISLKDSRDIVDSTLSIIKANTHILIGGNNMDKTIALYVTTRSTKDKRQQL